MTVDILEYYRRKDPFYGREQHQRDYMVRMVKLQDERPCIVDHGDKPHAPSCYDKKAAKP